jgi:hypothetical protein
MGSQLEYNKYGLKFNCICPESSETIKKQETTHKPFGVSVIAFLEEQKVIFDQIIGSIQCLGYYFKRVEDLHFTLLPLFDNKRKQNPYSLRLTYEAIERFFNEYEHKTGPLNIDCNIVRPGSFYKGKNEIPMLSDGTVIAMADQESSFTQMFIRVGNALAKHLQIQLPYIFDPSFGRPYTTMWCTLGYFCHDDFEITDEVRKTFEDINNNLSTGRQKITININKIKIIEFPKKSLDGHKQYGSHFTL